MKVRYTDSTRNHISISGEIDENYQIPPGKTIILEQSSTFKGTCVGGQILYNNEYIVKKFTLDESGELELIPIAKELELSAFMQEFSASEFLTEQPIKSELEKVIEQMQSDSKGLSLLITPPPSSSTIHITGQEETLVELPIRPLMRSETLAPTQEKELWRLEPLTERVTSPLSGKSESSLLSIPTLHRVLTIPWNEDIPAKPTARTELSISIPSIPTTISWAEGLKDHDDENSSSLSSVRPGTPRPSVTNARFESFIFPDITAENSNPGQVEEVQAAGETEIHIETTGCGCIVL